METENKTRLQKIKEQLEQKMTRAIVEAIEDGAKIERCCSGVIIDGVYISSGNKSEGISHATVLRLNSPEIDKLFEPDENEMRARADELRRELEKIERQLKSE